MYLLIRLVVFVLKTVNRFFGSGVMSEDVPYVMNHFEVTVSCIELTSALLCIPAALYEVIIW